MQACIVDYLLPTWTLNSPDAPGIATGNIIDPIFTADGSQFSEIAYYNYMLARGTDVAITHVYTIITRLNRRRSDVARVCEANNVGSGYKLVLGDRIQRADTYLREAASRLKAGHDATLLANLMQSLHI